MALFTALKYAPLVLLLACESKPEAHTSTPAATVAAPKAQTRPVPAKAARGAGQTFTWQDEACTSTGTFPAGAYTQRQLRGTYRVATDFILLTTTVAFNYRDYTDKYFQRAAAGLQHEHDSLAAVLRSLEVVPTAYWRNLKHLRELELAEAYAQEQTLLEGYFHPESWLRNQYYPHCRAYADALASTDTVVVLKAWRQLVNEQKRLNGYPEQLEREYVQVSATPEAMRYAKMQLMTFGWSNCANSLRKYNALDDQGMASPLNKFEQLFTHIERADCADTD